jgi:toxin YoeB
LKVIFSSQSWDEYVAWQAENPKLAARLNGLIYNTTRDPLRGIGKPEPLRENWKGWWSRRIDDEHRLIYRVTGAGDDQRLEIAQCRYQY